MNTLPAEIAEKYKGITPVPIVSIAKDLGLSIYETKDFDDSQSGSLKKEGENFVIYLNVNHPYTRQRFTIAHEIAHFLLHKSYFDTIAEHVSLIKQPYPALNRGGAVSTPEEQKMELDANQLAAELLMPEETFKYVWAHHNKIDEVANQFEVSQSAANFRASKLLNSFII